MFQPISFYIGLRYSRSRSRTGFVSFITFFSIAGIFLGVTSLITVVSVMNGFEGELKKRILGLVPHVIVSADDNNSSNTSYVKGGQPFDWQPLRKSMLLREHVTDVTPFVQTEALIASSKNLQGVLLQGILPEFEDNNIIQDHLISGSISSLENNRYQVVLGYALSRSLNVRVGDLVRLVLPNKTTFTPMGRIPVQRTFTVGGIFEVGSQVDDTMVYVHARDAAKLLRKTGDGIQQLRIYLDDAFQAKSFVDNIMLDSSFDANSVSFSTWSQSQGTLFSAVKMEKNMMWLMLSLIVAVAAFNIVSALVMVVIDKQGEIGILQTLGMSSGDIMKIFMTQGMLNGLWGVLFGAIGGVSLALYINDIMEFLGVNLLGAGYAAQQLPVIMNVEDVTAIIFGALLMSFVATLYPAYRASQTLPAEVLRNE